VIGFGKAAAFFDVEKNDSARAETFRFRSGDSGFSVASSSRFADCLRFEFGALRPAEEDKKPKALGAQEFALAGPSVGLFARRRAYPVTRKRKRLAQDWQRGVTGINVAVEAKVGALSGLLWRKSRIGNEHCNEQKYAPARSVRRFHGNSTLASFSLFLRPLC